MILGRSFLQSFKFSFCNLPLLYHSPFYKRLSLTRNDEVSQFVTNLFVYLLYRLGLSLIARILFQISLLLLSPTPFFLPPDSKTFPDFRYRTVKRASLTCFFFFFHFCFSIYFFFLSSKRLKVSTRISTRIRSEKRGPPFRNFFRNQRILVLGTEKSYRKKK